MLKTKAGNVTTDIITSADFSKDANTRLLGVNYRPSPMGIDFFVRPMDQSQNEWLLLRYDFEAGTIEMARFDVETKSMVHIKTFS